jgi:hypothetical protein
MADLAFRTEGKERLRQTFQKLFASGGRREQIAADAMQPLAAKREFLLAEAIGQEAEVTDALKAARQSVEEKAADELCGGEGQGFRLSWLVGFAIMVSGLPVGVCFANIFPLKRDLPVFEREQTLIGESDAMRVAAEIFEHLLRAAEGWFGVDNPSALFHGV